MRGCAATRLRASGTRSRFAPARPYFAAAGALPVNRSVAANSRSGNERMRADDLQLAEPQAKRLPQLAGLGVLADDARGRRALVGEPIEVGEFVRALVLFAHDLRVGPDVPELGPLVTRGERAGERVLAGVVEDENPRLARELQTFGGPQRSRLAQEARRGKPSRLERQHAGYGQEVAGVLGELELLQLPR